MGPLFNATRLPTGALERTRAQAALGRVALGDSQAVAELYARYSHGIYSYIRTIVTDRHEAEDVTQQVFLKLMTAARRSNPVHTDLSGWLLRVARNAALDSLRRKRRTLLLDPQEWAPADVAPDQELRRSLEEAVGELSQGQRDVLLLRDLLGLSPHEAAERLGKSEGAVHMLHHRARRSVCARLASSGRAPSTRGGRREAG
jgi:RNA polymerase sigma-70 factor (ECF subfamily)